MTFAQPAKHPDERRRRNAPVVPDKRLPAAGRKGRAPDCPVRLDAAGERWWQWCWHTPQATQFNRGNLYPLARRAQLEDEFEREPFGDVTGTQADRRLKILTHMFAIDERFGLTPYGAAKLHWWVEKEEEKPPGTLSAVSDFGAKQRAKDFAASAVAGS